MNIIKLNSLTVAEENEILALEKLCKKHDGIYNDVYLNNALNFDNKLPCYFCAYEEQILVGFIAVFVPTRMEAEITAFTHPDFRCKGIFKKLFEEVKKTMLSVGITRFLFVVESASKSGGEVVKHLDSARVFNTELTLECKKSSPEFYPKNCHITEVNQENKTIASKLLGSVFGDFSGSEAFINTGLEEPDREVFMAYDGEIPVGVVNIYYKEKSAMIYGLMVTEIYRRKGFGKALLTFARERALKSRHKVYLDVDTNNKTAVELYLANGFKKVSQTYYYIFTEAV
ncbi:MAG: hypothetical protein DBX47_00410 [Clostridiales bacterium]|nr:MAG: hypothetical protein DBX47_00410 [Clostridiales bacterium]